MMNRNATCVLALALAGFLAACGGGGGGEGNGGGSGGGNDPSGPESPTSGTQPSPSQGYYSLASAAIATPSLGRRSVIQSSNKGRDNVTTDKVTGVFDRGQLELIVTREDGTSFILTSHENAAVRLTATPIRTGQAAENWILRSGSGGSTTTAYAFGERPADQFPLRAVHAGGNWGTHGQVVESWEARNRRGKLVPQDHIEYLKSLNVDWVGLSVALHYDDSLDSTVERVYSSDVGISTFEDDVLRQFIREFRAAGMDVYLTLAFEAHEAENSDRPVHRWQLGDPVTPESLGTDDWPWNPGHPDHERFVEEFWTTYTEQAVHFARLAQEEGARMFSLGTETERLFRTRSGGRWSNDFRDELQDMVASVRRVFSGQVTYDMHYDALTADHFYGPGSANLWEDLDLDMVGISSWFPVADSVPSTVASVGSLQERYEEIFREHLIPLAERNPGRPIVLLEHGAADEVASPARPANTTTAPFEFTDRNGNGLDDGRETQANMYHALLNTMARYPGVVDGVFLWGNWVSSSEDWYDYWTTHRNFPIRGKLAEDVVRLAYEAWGDWLTGGHWMLVSDTMEVIEAGAFVDSPELSGTPRLPSAGTASYGGLAQGGYAIVHGGELAGLAAGSHEIGTYEGRLELSADFSAGLIGGKVHSILVSGVQSPQAGGTRQIANSPTTWEIVLEAASLGAGGFAGDTRVTSSAPALDISDTSGSWGGKLSNMPDGDGIPRLAAGTHGSRFSTAGGTEGSFIGVFAGATK